MEDPLKNALPILASAFGNKIGVTVHFGGETARTNGEHIIIPMISDPKLRNVVLGYLAHEAAHVRLTDFDVFADESGVSRNLTNILEDQRIEKSLYDNDYPGTKKWFSAVYDHMCQKNAPEDLLLDNLAGLFLNYLLHRFRDRQFGTELGRYAVDVLQHAVEERLPAGFFVRLDVLIDKYFDAMASTQDAVDLAKAILTALKEAEEEEKQKQEQDDHSDKSNKDLNDQSSSPENSNQDGPQVQKAAGDSCDSGTDSEATSNVPSSDHSDAQSASGGEKSLIDQILSEADLPGDMMDGIAKDLDSQASEEAQSNPQQQHLVRLNSEVGSEVSKNNNAMMGLDTLKEGILASSQLRSQLTGLLQAQTRTRRSIRECGTRLDSRRLSRAVCGEQRVWKHKDQRKMLDTSVHILLDTSSSMRQIQHIANSATVSMALAINGIPKVDVAVSIFPGIGAGASPLLKRKCPARSNMEKFAVSSSGGTPMADAMFYAVRELTTVSNCHRKVIIVITDGAPNNGETVQYLNRLIAGHIDVYAIGIHSEAVKHYFEKYQVINDVHQLQHALFHLARDFLKVA